MSKLFLGLPAYNEQDSIRPLFKRIKELNEILSIPTVVMVYDDGSQDGTREEVLKWTSYFELIYLDGVINKGLGPGMNTLIFEFAKRSNKDDYLIVMDCDNTHDPLQILEMLKVFQAHPETDVVIASRYRNGATIKGVSFKRILLSFGAAILYKCVHPILHTRDYTCGYRAYRHTIIKNALSQFKPPFLKEQGFSCMVELLLKLKKAGAKVREIPLQLAYDNKLSLSKMDVSGNIFRLSKKLLTWRLGEME